MCAGLSIAIVGFATFGSGDINNGCTSTLLFLLAGLACGTLGMAVSACHALQSDLDAYLASFLTYSIGSVSYGFSFFFAAVGLGAAAILVLTTGFNLFSYCDCGCDEPPPARHAGLTEAAPLLQHADSGPAAPAYTDVAAAPAPPQGCPHCAHCQTSRDRK